jgi:hypothetical protein
MDLHEWNEYCRLNRELIKTNKDLEELEKSKSVLKEEEYIKKKGSLEIDRDYLKRACFFLNPPVRENKYLELPADF